MKVKQWQVDKRHGEAGGGAEASVNGRQEQLPQCCTCRVHAACLLCAVYVGGLSIQLIRRVSVESMAAHRM